MYAIRQLQPVTNGQVIVQIPADFPTDQVEVIVLPAPLVNGKVDHQADEEMDPAIQSFLALDTSHLTVDQLVAYQRAAEVLRKGRRPDEPRIFGLFAGLVKVADDFDAPLPDDIIDLFYGSETDEYGISLPR